MSSFFRRRPGAFLLLALTGWALLFASCVVVNRTIMAPPQILGATFVGSEKCIKCHTNVTSVFHDATHAHVQMKTEDGKTKDIGCESCHGPASVHVSDGKASSIVGRKLAAENCFQCHLEVRAQFSLPHAHPLIAGKISCSDCHDPHKGDASIGSAKKLSAANDTCLACHTAQRGPFVFEHEAMRDGCISCHQPHGSPNDKLLKARNQTLCTSCHLQQQTNTTAIVFGGSDHTNFIARGTCWVSGCHEAVHGSHVNSSLRY